MKSADQLLREYIAHLRVEKGLARNTTSAYERDLSRFVAYIEEHGISFDSLTTQDLQEYVAHLRGKGGGRSLAESSISRAVVALRNFYSFASSEAGFLNPIKEFNPPKIPKRLPKALSIVDIESLVAHAYREGEVNSLRDVALIELLYATGGRVSEIISLTLSDISKLGDSDDLAIRLKGKGGKERVVPVGKYAQKSLDQYLVRVRPALAGERRVQSLFLNTRGT